MPDINSKRRARYTLSNDARTSIVSLLLAVAVLLNLYCGGMSFLQTSSAIVKGDDYISFSRLNIDDNVGEDIKLTLLKLNGEGAAHKNMFSSNTDEPTILIYHTHTTEAYKQVSGSEYKENGGKWRTRDNTKNIVTVGEKLANELRDMGYNVLHDTTDHEPPKLSTSYSRSLVTMEKYKKEYPSLEVFIDVHRDAYSTDGNATDYCEIDGIRAAKLMFVVGTGEGATGAGFGDMPDFESNFDLAKGISDKLESFSKSLVREIRVKTGRYNQHVSSMCLLVEVGHNNNTLEEALNSVDYLAKAMDEVFSGKEA